LVSTVGMGADFIQEPNPSHGCRFAFGIQCSVFSIQKLPLMGSLHRRDGTGTAWESLQIFSHARATLFWGGVLELRLGVRVDWQCALNSGLHALSARWKCD